MAVDTSALVPRPAPVLGGASVAAAGRSVSWRAVVAGALAAAALSLILLVLGTGLGLSSASPWVDRGASAQALGMGAIYGTGAIAGGVLFVRAAARLSRHPGRDTARASFRASLLQLALLLAAAIADRLV